MAWLVVLFRGAVGRRPRTWSEIAAAGHGRTLPLRPGLPSATMHLMSVEVRGRYHRGFWSIGFHQSGALLISGRGVTVAPDGAAANTIPWADIRVMDAYPRLLGTYVGVTIGRRRRVTFQPHDLAAVREAVLRWAPPHVRGFKRARSNV